MQISFNEATAYRCSNLQYDLQLCEKAGFDYIELRGDMLLDYLVEHKVEDLIDFFSNSHLKPHAINALYTYWGMFDKLNRNAERDRALMSYFLTCCQVSKAIGNHYFIVVPDLLDDANNIYCPHDGQNMDYPYDSNEVTEKYVYILRKLAKIAEEYEMNLCFEPVGSCGCAVRTIDHALQIIQEVDYNNVGLVLDSFNLYLNGKSNDFSDITKVPVEKVFAVHINNSDDIPIGILDHQHRRFVDSGCLNLHGFLSALKQIGYTGMVSIETFRPEYYCLPPQNVISTAYVTTKKLIDSYR